MSVSLIAALERLLWRLQSRLVCAISLPVTTGVSKLYSTNVATMRRMVTRVVIRRASSRSVPKEAAT